MTERSLEAARRAAEAFTKRLEETFPGSLHSVLLYGSAARGEYRPGISDLNLLVILTELALADLQRAAPATRQWVADGNPPPLMMSLREWRSSADVFPLEYSDIRDAHLVLHGDDPFQQMTIHREHLRLQVEHELRSKKIQLREGYLVAGESAEHLGELLLRSLPTFLTLFRATLRLAGRAVPAAGGDLIDAAAAEIGFDAAPVHEVLRARAAEKPFTAPLDGAVAAGYLRAVERAATWLDEAAGTLSGPETV